MNNEETLLIGAHDHERYIEEPEATIDANLESETKYLITSSGPLVVTFFLQYLLSVTSIFITGKLGATELAASSLAVCTFNITGLAVYQGMATSLDTFCSQAFGSGNIKMVGLYFQRCSLITLTITAFPLCFIWWFSGSLLKFLIPDEKLVMMTQQFLRINMIGAPGLLLFETGKRFLQAQHLFNAGTYILLIVAPLNLLLHWTLVWHPRFGMGFIGAPIAISIIYWVISGMMLLYVLFIDGKKCWGGFSLKALYNWGAMLKLAIPGVIMVEAEYLAFEILTILAASFGTEALAAQSIASNVGSLAFQLPFAFAVSLTTRIGHYIGMQNLKGAQLVTKLGVLVALTIAVFNFSAVFFNRRLLGSLFSNSPEVLDISSNILILVAINQISDAFNVVGTGILRGQGRQRLGSILNMIAYYLIALPVGYICGFVLDWKLSGLWAGLILGVFTLAVSEFISIFTGDWNAILIDNLNRHDH